MKYIPYTLIALVSLSLFAAGCVEKKPRALPNVVILYADDMGYGDLNCQNPQSKIPTPYLDTLAQQGMRFTDAHSASGVCSPSRYSLLTGRYHWRGHLKKDIIGAWGDPAIEEGRATIASLLQQKGYHTACIGKWHLGMVWPFKPGVGQNSPDKSQWSQRIKAQYTPADFDWEKPIESGPLAYGFDYYFGDGTINLPPYAWIENDRVMTPPSVMIDMSGKKTAEGQWELRPGPAAEGWDIPEVPIKLTEKATEWIAAQASSKQPFFLYFALPSPHAPIVPAQAFRGKSEAGGYGDYMVQTDWMVGQVIKALKVHGMDENTLVIFTSDNGPELYAYERIKNHDHYSMGELRGVKRDLWEGGHRVPFIVKYPGVVPRNSVNHHLICQTDLLKTIADFTGLKVPENAGEDSQSFSRMLTDEESTQPTRQSVVHHTVNGKFAMRQGDWVLIENPTGMVTRQPSWMTEPYKDEPETPMALYHLAQDRGERKNLYSKYPERVKALQQLLAKTRGY